MQKPLLRALNLLSMVWPETSVQQWADISIGERDTHLLMLREELFGNRLESIATCSRCGEKIELSFDTQDLRVTPAASTEQQLRVEVDGHLVQFRLPSSADLLAIEDGCDEKDTRNMLLKRCLQAKVGEQHMEPEQLPVPVMDAVIKKMADADPQADVQIALACPSCQHAWSIHFDILSYLWDEIEDWAFRVLREVHILARAYGWSEQEILTMSSRRRQLYLEMATG